MELWVEAFIFGLVSALSFPIGSVIGQLMSPIRVDVIAGCVAFGAGALLFAVTVEIYGHLLTEFHHGRIGQAMMIVTIVCTYAGAAAYLYLNCWMEKMMEGDEGEEEHSDIADVASEDDAASAASEDFDGGGHDAETKTVGAGYARLSEQNRNSLEAVPEKKGQMVFSASEKIGARKSLAPTGTRKTIAFLATTRPEAAEQFENMEGRKAKMSCFLSEWQRPAAVTKVESIKEEVRSSTVSTVSEEAEQAGNMKLAMAMFLGLVVDGIPEAILLGFLAAKQHLSYVLVVSLFLANFPESFSSSSLMAEAHVSSVTITGMWTGLCLLTGVLSAIACQSLLYLHAVGHEHVSIGVQFLVSGVEGLAGGAMLCCICAVMLPEAFERRNKKYVLLSPGFLAASGFLAAVVIKTFGGGVHDDMLVGEQASHHFLVQEAFDSPHEAVGLFAHRFLRHR